MICTTGLFSALKRVLACAGPSRVANSPVIRRDKNIWRYHAWPRASGDKVADSTEGITEKVKTINRVRFKMANKAAVFIALVGDASKQIKRASGETISFSGVSNVSQAFRIHP